MIDGQLITGFQSAPIIGMSGVDDLGQVSLSSDISSWGLGEWAAVIGIAYVSISLFFDLKSAGSHVGKKSKRTKRKIAKSAAGATGKIGTVVAVGALAGAGYIAYEAFQGQGATQ